MSADFVVDLLQAPMRKMPAKVQLLQHYAACLGSLSSTHPLDLIWRQQSVMKTEYSADTIANLLAVVVSSTLVEAFGQTELRQTFQTGTAVYHLLDANELEEYLFDVVDLINKERASKPISKQLKKPRKSQLLKALQCVFRMEQTCSPATNGIWTVDLKELGVDVLWNRVTVPFQAVSAVRVRVTKHGEKFAELELGMFLVIFETFHRAIALFVMARRTKKRKYRTSANKLAQRIEGWRRSCNMNVGHYHMALLVEQPALNNKYDLAEKNYENAIVLAARSGRMHRTALTNERYADFLHNEHMDEQESKYRLGEAIQFFEEWGACGKVVGF
eukprot:scaffold18306_cov117-Cylindrotheca_fusiformis.AAC.2